MNIRGTSSLILLLLSLLPPQSTHALSNPCDPSHVELDGAAFVLKPSGQDDTENIQCALNAAIDQGIGKVELSKGTFEISRLEVKNFEGTLTGVSKTNAQIDVSDSSIDCSSMEAEGSRPAVIKFVEGSPRLQRMSIVSGNFCDASGSKYRPTVVHFSGTASTSSDCSNDVIFGVVDRVAMFSVAETP